MTKKIITTVGTSLFTNFMKKEVKESNEFRDDYKSIDEVFSKLEKIGNSAAEDAQTDINTLKKTIEDYWLDKPRPKASAEISSLLKIAESEPIEVYLLATETALSVAACQLIKDYLLSENNTDKGRFVKVHFVESEHIIEGLQVTDAKSFEKKGFINLVDLILKIKGKESDTVLNISGGYKALIPPITLLAQLEKMTLYYLYEDSNEPIETGNLPINFDWGIIEEYIVYLHNENKRNNAPDTEIESMRKLKLVKYESRDLTIIGQLIAKYSQQASPFTTTIFGYFIEHKLYECYSKKYGREKVEHSFKYEGMGSEDIDIIITPEKHQFISIEIKPFYVLEDSEKMQKITDAFIKRVPIAKEKGERGNPSEIWLLLYSYPETKEETKTLSESELEIVNKLSINLKEKFYPDIVFRVKHLFIVKNKLNGERHIYQTFMKKIIEIDEIKEIFNSSKIKI